jgi:hypothetical protein
MRVKITLFVSCKHYAIRVKHTSKLLTYYFFFFAHSWGGVITPITPSHGSTPGHDHPTYPIQHLKTVRIHANS